MSLFESLRCYLILPGLKCIFSCAVSWGRGLYYTEHGDITFQVDVKAIYFKHSRAAHSASIVRIGLKKTRKTGDSFFTHYKSMVII